MDIELIISENYNLNSEFQSQDYSASPKGEPDTILFSLRMKSELISTSSQYMSNWQN